MKKFTIAQAALILTIAVGRLREWISRGYIAPFEKSSGRGSSHKLDVQNLYEIKLFDHLLSKRGLSRAKAVNVIREVKKNRFANDNVIICSLEKGMGIFNYGVKDGKTVIETNDDFHDFLVVNYRNIKNDVDSRI